MAQDCPPATSTNGVLLEGNNYTAFFKADGSPLWSSDGIQEEGLEYDDPISGRIGTIFAQGIWLGGNDSQGNLLVSAPMYNTSSFIPGPLGQDGQPASENCSDFNRAWNVRRFEIEAHLADYADNQVIDTPIPAIMGWPGRDNPDFFTYNGFELPIGTSASAPYFDANNDGRYTPAQGDYPVEPTHLKVAEHLVWTVSNTTGAATSVSEFPFPTQLETTAWAFLCGDNELLNDAIFTRYKLTNLSGENFENVRFGLWTDFDLGCFTDDNIGVDTLTRTSYAYNADNIDNNPCGFGIPSAGENPPVQSITFLNQTLDAFTYFVNPSVAAPAPETTDPITAAEIYNFMNARWRDGSPLQVSGNGYDQGPDVPETNYAFSGSPNDPDSWSMNNVDLPPGDLRTLSVTNINSFVPGQIWSIDVAYAYHREEGEDHLGNVNVMIENVAEIQSLYDESWDNTCTPLTCDDGIDCVFAGDLNADGIANYVDLVALSFGWSSTGPERNGPYIWAPCTGTDWDEAQEVGPNQKHLDANGDGIINEADFDETLEHYNLTRIGYAPEVTPTEGLQLQFVIGTLDNPINVMNPGQTKPARVYITSDVPDLRAVSYEVEYDPAYFSPFVVSSTAQEISDEDFNYAKRATTRLFECVSVEKLNNFPQNETGLALTFILGTRSDFPTDFPATPTEIRFRNVRGWLADGTEVALGSTGTVVDIEGVTNSISEPNWATDVNFYPNPASNFLQLELNNAPVEQVEVINTFGQVNLQVDGNTNRLDLSNLPAGTYFLRMSGREGVVTRKFIKN